jgi:hypothetical protein
MEHNRIAALERQRARSISGTPAVGVTQPQPHQAYHPTPQSNNQPQALFQPRYGLMQAQQTPSFAATQLPGGSDRYLIPSTGLLGQAGMQPPTGRWDAWVTQPANPWGSAPRPQFPAGPVGYQHRQQQPLQPAFDPLRQTHPVSSFGAPELQWQPQPQGLWNYQLPSALPEPHQSLAAQQQKRRIPQHPVEHPPLLLQQHQAKKVRPGKIHAPGKYGPDTCFEFAAAGASHPPSKKKVMQQATLKETMQRWRASKAATGPAVSSEHQGGDDEADLQCPTKTSLEDRRAQAGPAMQQEEDEEDEGELFEDASSRAVAASATAYSAPLGSLAEAASASMTTPSDWTAATAAASPGLGSVAKPVGRFRMPPLPPHIGAGGIAGSAPKPLGRDTQPPGTAARVELRRKAHLALCVDPGEEIHEREWHFNLYLKFH